VSRASGVLLLVIAAEAVGGGVLVARRLDRPVPPQADWALLDPATAGQIRASAAACASADDWRNLGELYMAAGCFAESEECHRTACELAPGNALFARQWGFALERLSLLDEANAQYRRAIDLGTPDPDACRYFIARNHLRADNPAEARRVFAEGRALPANRYELARLHLRAGELAETADLLRSVAEVRPNALQVHLLGYRLAVARDDARQAFACADHARYAPEKLPNPFDEEAERIVGATEALGPNRTWTPARDLIEEGRLDDAERLLDEAGRVYRSPAVVELLAEVAVRRERFEQGLALFEEFQEMNGPAARIIARMGDVWEAAGDPSKARASWLRAARLGAGLDLQATHQKLAVSFARAGDQPAADRHLALSHYFAGRELLQRGRPDQAAASFAAAVERDPALAQGWFYLGESRRLTGQTGPAAEAYRACLRLNPDHGRALVGLDALGAGPGG
jgi:tetratricopeptide (TPR) repeat protein